jgi:N-acetylneuraminic acid mutarotase
MKSNPLFAFKSRPGNYHLLALVWFSILSQQLSIGFAQGNAFTYQGRLNSDGSPVSGSYDLAFTLFDTATGGASVGNFVLLTAVPVSNGLFTVTLNTHDEFGPTAFNGAARWLEIGVRINTNVVLNFTTLTPRQPLTAAPYAAFAFNAASANTVPDGAITSAMLAIGAVTTVNIASNSITAAQLAPGAAADNLGGSGLGGVPATAIVLSDIEVNTSLLNAGFIVTSLLMTNRLDAWASIADGPPATGVLTHERYNHVAVWVANFNAMFIFGGYPNRVGLRYHPGSNVWSSITEINAPVLGQECFAAWTGSRLVVWDSKNRTGGRYNPSNNTWQTISDTNAPSSRERPAAVWTGSRLLVWGGSGGGYHSGGASYNPTTDTWQAITSTGAPAARAGAVAVWSGTEMIVQGGYDSNDTFGGGGRYNPTSNTWTPVTTGGNASLIRSGHSAVWTGSRMIIVGGHRLVNLNTVYQTNGFSYNPGTDTWSPIANHAVIAQLEDHNAVWSGTHMFIWGGRFNTNGARYTPGTDTWTVLPTTGVAARNRSAAVWTGTDLIGWGGYLPVIGGDPTDDGRRYNLTTNVWTALPIPAASGETSERTDPTAVWTGDRLIVWGGNNNGVDFRTGGIYRPGVGWTNTPTTGAPSARSGHTAVWTGTEMIVWGGEDGVTVNSGARFNVASNKWFSMNLSNAPVSRRNHSAVWTGTEMIIWGGYQRTNLFDQNFLNTGGSYNPATDSWVTNFPVNGIVGSRANHTAVWTGTEMLIWGGYRRTGPILSPTFTYYGTGARYTPGSNSLVTLPLPPAGNARTDHTAVWTGSDMLIWGGVNDLGETNSGLRFNPASNLWTALPTNNAPAVRSDHTAVWTGEFMIIYGGAAGGSSVGTAALFDPLVNKWSATTANVSGRHRHVAVWTGTNMLTGNGQPGANPVDTWTSFTPREIFYFYQKP